MANKVRGEIAADFEGGKINLMLSVNAICELEDATDRPITDLLDEISDPKRARMKTVRSMFWAMMLAAKPEATLKDAGALIDGLRGKHDRILTDAILAAFPEADEAGEGAPEK